MNPINESWVAHLDVTGRCQHACTYCSRYSRHLRTDQRYDMSLQQVEQALQSLEGWPNLVGLIGGEPVLHPQFAEICRLYQKYFPKEKCYLWTSGGPKYQEYLPVINETFIYICYNEHNEHQKETCRHQPLTLAIDEMIPDKELRDKLIDNCWVQLTWAPTINYFGAYFCEVGAAQDLILNEGKNAWPVENGWWHKTPEQFQDQVQALCGKCGMAIPTERQLIKDTKEKFTPLLLEEFRAKGLRKVSDDDVEVVYDTLSKEQIQQNISKWYPGNYRGDLADDSACCEGPGFKGEL